MYLPMDNDLYYAEKGKGSWKNIEPLRKVDRGPLRDQLIAYSFDYNEDPGKTMAEMEVLGRLTARVRNIRSTNSLYDFCWAVDGRLGAAINQATRIWDIAAPTLLFSEAGGKVTDVHGQEIEFDLSAGAMTRNYTILASSPGIHEELAGILKKPSHS
jgi:myo-inositol-1(or 4)-monophosphatase